MLIDFADALSTNVYRSKYFSKTGSSYCISHFQCRSCFVHFRFAWKLEFGEGMSGVIKKDANVLFREDE
jgi:hypothetical protein